MGAREAAAATAPVAAPVVDAGAADQQQLLLLLEQRQAELDAELAQEQLRSAEAEGLVQQQDAELAVVQQQLADLAARVEVRAGQGQGCVD